VAWSPQQMVNAWTATQDADKVDGLAAAWHSSMAALTAMQEFHTWQRSNPAFKQLLTGRSGRRRPAARHSPARHRSDTLFHLRSPGRGAGPRLAAARGLQQSGQPGPTRPTAAAGEALGLTGPVLVHLSLGDTFRESLLASLMDMDVGADLILSWDWILSHDLQHIHADCHVRF
jgi:hypothetical protein